MINIRLKLIISFILICTAILMSRIIYISIIKHDYYKTKAYNLTLHSEYIAPVRGMITDRFDNQLAINKLGFSIFMKPNLRFKSKQNILNKELDFIVSLFPYLKKDKLKKIYLKKDSPYNHNYIQIASFVNYDDMLRNYTRLLQHKNILVKSASKRLYPYNEISSHILGYVGRANEKELKVNKISKYTGYVGKSGLEKYYDSYLQDSVGKRNILVNAMNEELQELSVTKPTKSDIKITIDINLQKYISNIFKQSAKSGVAIVMDIRDGSILAAGSYPEYDLNMFADGISYKKWDKIIKDLNHPFTNKIINGVYPPGSIIKMGVASAFLFNDTISAKDKEECNGSIIIGKRHKRFRCWKGWGHGKVNMTKAIRESCDVYFYNNSLKLGINKISETLARFGFGKKTGVDLPNEFFGVAPNKQWKERKYNLSWYIGDTINSSIGQGYVLVTPLQIAKYMAVLVTKKDITPHFIDSIDSKHIDFKAKEIFTKKEKRKLNLLRQGMFDVANNKRGTAFKHLLDAPFEIGAKTGTAQVIGIAKEEKERMKEEELKYYHRSHAWMATYGPYKNPRYVVVVLVEHGGHGGSSTGHIVTDIYTYLNDNYLHRPIVKRFLEEHR